MAWEEPNGRWGWVTQTAAGRASWSHFSSRLTLNPSQCSNDQESFHTEWLFSWMCEMSGKGAKVSVQFLVGSFVHCQKERNPQMALWGQSGQTAFVIWLILFKQLCHCLSSESLKIICSIMSGRGGRERSAQKTVSCDTQWQEAITFIDDYLWNPGVPVGLQMTCISQSQQQHLLLGDSSN